MYDFVRIGTVLLAVAIKLFAVSIALAYYDAAYATDAAGRYMYYGIAVFTASVAFAAPFLLRAVKPTFGAWLVCWSAIGACVLIDVLTCLGALQMTRGTSVAGREGDATEYHQAQADVTRLQILSTEYAGGKAVAELTQELANRERVTPGCKHVYNAGLAACGQISTIKLALERAKERDKRQAALEAAQARVASLKRPDAAPDPQKESVRQIMRVFRIEHLATHTDLVWRVLVVFLFEAVPPMLLALALHGGRAIEPTPHIPQLRTGRPSPPRATKPTSPPVRRAPVTLASDPAGKPVRAARSSGNVPLIALKEVLDGKRTAHGIHVGAQTLEGSQRALAAACGVSAASFNKRLKCGASLAMAGIARVDVSSRGTVVQFA